MKPDKPHRRRSTADWARGAEAVAGTILGVALMACFLLTGRSSTSNAASQVIFPNASPGWLVVAALAACIVVNAAYSAAETALSLVKHMHVKHVTELNPHKGERLHA